VEPLDLTTLTGLATAATTPAAGPCVTLLAPVGLPTEQGRAVLTWRSLLREAAGRGGDPGLLAPAEALADGWPRHGGSLAMVLGLAPAHAPGPTRGPGAHWTGFVPASVEPFVAVGEVPAFAALVLASRAPRFVLLTLGLQDTALYAVDGDVVQPLEAGLPRGLDDAVPARERGQHVVHHGGSGSGVMPSHGQADADREHDHELDEFCRIVARHVWAHVGADDPRPVVVAGVGDLVARLRAASADPDRIVAVVPGTVERVAVAELAARGAAALGPVRSPATRAWLERFHHRQGSGLASGDLDELAAEAAHGRVAALLVPESADRTDPRLDRAIAGALAGRAEVLVVAAGDLDAPGAVYRW
jgi:hypothetical protein